MKDVMGPCRFSYLHVRGLTTTIQIETMKSATGCSLRELESESDLEARQNTNVSENIDPERQSDSLNMYSTRLATQNVKT